MTFAPARVLEMQARLWQKEKKIWRPKEKWACHSGLELLVKKWQYVVVYITKIWLYTEQTDFFSFFITICCTLAKYCIDTVRVVNLMPYTLWNVTRVTGVRGGEMWEAFRDLWLHKMWAWYLCQVWRSQTLHLSLDEWESGRCFWHGDYIPSLWNNHTGLSKGRKESIKQSKRIEFIGKEIQFSHHGKR